MHISDIDHIVLDVADVEASLRFYMELGLRPERLDAYRRGDVKFPSIRINAHTLIDLFPPEMHGRVRTSGKNLNHFALVADEPMPNVRDYLRAKAVDIEEEADNNFGARGLAESVYVRDPDGNRIEIRTYS